MKKYSVEVSQRFKKGFNKFDKYTQRMIKAWIDKNIVDCENPRAHGKPLSVNRSDQCRYKIGDYRLICLIDDNKVVILAISVGHRKEIYKN